MTRPIHLEFYKAGTNTLIAAIDSYSVPSVDEFISIEGKTYRIGSRTWAIDHAAEHSRKQMRANVDLIPA